MKPITERDKKLGRFSLEVCLKRQKFLVHGFEAKTLKHIPKLLYVICERLVRLSDSNRYCTACLNLNCSLVVSTFSSARGNNLLIR